MHDVPQNTSRHPAETSRLTPEVGTSGPAVEEQLARVRRLLMAVLLVLAALLLVVAFATSASEETHTCRTFTRFVSGEVEGRKVYLEACTSCGRVYHPEIRRYPR